MRQRISWDMKKVAEISKKADPYTMNQDHANNPIEKYHTGDPSSWAEDQDTRTPWQGEGRNEVGLPSPASEAPAAAAPAAPAPEATPEMAPEQQAVMAARKLEDKALKCITVAQRMLPGASDQLVEAQATDLMYLPERCVLATLQRQAELAEDLAKKDEEEEEEATATAAEKCKEDDEDDEDEATATAADQNAAPAAAPVPAPEGEVKPEEKEEKKDDEDEEGGEATAAAKKDDAEEDEEGSEGVTASQDLLDQIFAQTTPKTGAKKLSGIVKQASTGSSSLDGLWNCPPDVSEAFR